MIYNLGATHRKSRLIADESVELHGNESYDPSGFLYATSPPTSMKVRESNESIVYTGHRKRSNSRLSNLCIHTKYRRKYSGDPTAPFHLSYVDGYHSKYWSWHNTAQLKHDQAIAAAYAAWDVITGTTYLGLNGQGLINNAMQELTPNLTKFSLPNDILDWKQLGSLFNFWNKNRSLVTNLAGQRLNHRFGWIPTIADLDQLTFGLIELKQSLNNFQALRGVTIAARKTVLKETIVKVGSTDFDANVRYQWWGLINRRAHAYLVYAPQQIVSLNQIDLTLRALMDHMGIELNPRILWDKIPFSFVIDWIVDVGAFLDRFHHDALELPIQVIDTYLDYKENIQVDSNTEIGGFPPGYVSDGKLPGVTSTTEIFHRLPIRPDYATFAGLNFKWPSFNQAVNAVALGVTLAGGHVDTFSRKLKTLENGAGKSAGLLAGYYDYD